MVKKEEMLGERKSMVRKYCRFEELRAFCYDWSIKVYVGSVLALYLIWDHIVRFLGYFKML